MILSADCILTSLAISRISQLWIILLDSFLIALWPHLYAFNKLVKFIGILGALTNHLVTWLAAGLSVFYFFKIVNFCHPCFIWLRWRISRVLLILPLGSLFLRVFNLALTGGLSDLWINSYTTYERNSSWSLDVRKILYCNVWILASLTYLISFLLSLISPLLLILSLIKRIRSLQLNTMGPRNLRMKAHKRAVKMKMKMKMMVSFLLFFLVHFASLLLTGWIFLVQQK
ncbi:PREDICTED: putative taste receptor type 2 member 12 [Cercocebus atys]|uniref:putative taste receptor type 2 member 12 n=1 Tax=Cercocebus atys TaxID=9531 RepID=UPI0005F4C9F5|nr:PREDICTED: putative taste receptor type 2 member 12 [Cercocebus atys]